MQIRLSPSMKSINISTNSNGFFDLMKVKVAARHISYRTLFHTVLVLAFLLPFVFILTAVVTLEGVNKCSSFDCLGRRLGPRFLSRGADDSERFLRDLYALLDQANSLEIPDGLKFPDSYEEFLSETSHNFDANTFAVMLKGTMEHMNMEAKKARLAEQLHKHFAAISIPKGLHCLSLRLTDEYSSNAHARKQLPPPELLPFLSNNSYYHIVIATDNILAASVVVNSAVRSSINSGMMVFHVITDKKTYPAMHSWFALNPIFPAIIELKGIHQFNWLTRENVPVIEAIENHHHVRTHYHKNTVTEANISDNPRVFASRLQARSPKYISLLNHLRIYLPEMFPRLDKVVFLDDDVVVQRDLARLWDIDLYGKVNGAVETCRGEDSWVMSKRFRTYFNFSHPLILKNLNPDECAWAYGMNIFDLKAWRKTQIRETYHHWMKENLNSNLTLWKLGTLPPALIAFRGQVHPIDPSWHLLGLGYQENTNLDKARKASVIHYNGQCKPWLEIGYRQLQPFWTNHVNYSNVFIKSCHILKPTD